ncbi:hypothetical protein BUE80_DR013067 [Diplocarpon rosae]|nr:hypothetical protein BUE80_DR013067 [Diplocarpon rosae]
MFDVSWTDPDRETVGQRKIRKEQEIANGTDGKSQGLSRRSSIRSSESSGSNFNQKPSLLNLFGSSRKDGGSRTGHRSRFPNAPATDPAYASKRLSSFTGETDYSGPELPLAPLATARIPPSGFFVGSPYYSEAELSARSDASESVFSGWTEQSTKTDSTYGSVSEAPHFSAPDSIVVGVKGSTCYGSEKTQKTAQSLSENSFITQSTEITVSSSDNIEAAEQTATTVHISALDSSTAEVQDSSNIIIPSTTFVFPLPNCQSPEVPPKISSRKEGAHQGSTFPVIKRTKPFYTWKPPETWGCDDGTLKVSPPRVFSAPLRPIKERRHKAPPAEIAHLRKSIRRMDAASPKIILERLKEEWVGVADASVYRELELEKQLWMLTALRSLKKKNSLEDISEAQISGSPKILSLYENHASSSSLSALTTATEVHHLSTSPLSPKSYPNVHPLSVPRPTTQLPYASNSFSHIYAFSIPSLLPASSIPSILEECHRTLISAAETLSSPPTSISTSPSHSVPPFVTTTPSKSSNRGGTLHLTILDPSPLPATLGPLLRAWLDNNLILHLEKQFRCINPSRLFPVWLSDAGLRAPGSTIVNVRFFASVTPSGHPANGVEEEMENTRHELKSVVGRMLWKEMWGAYVQGQKWWWEDEGIVEECEKMGTAWEYAVVEAVKEM